MNRWLVGTQIALSLVLLIVAAMFLRSMARLRAVDLGFRAPQVVTVSLEPGLPGNSTAVAREQFWQQVLTQVRALPGVQSAALSVLTPLSGRDTSTSLVIPGYESNGEDDRRIRLNHVSEDYFKTFAVDVRSGRSFVASDPGDGRKVVVINEAAANRFFSGKDPLGQLVQLGGGERREVVGVVRDHKHRSLREAAPPFAFVPLWQGLEQPGRITLSLRSDQPLALIVNAAAREVKALRPSTLASDLLTVEEQVDETLAGDRLLTRIVTGFMILAVGLAAVGLYGLLGYAVAQRRAEFGVRLALGASARDILGAVLRGMLPPLGVGVAAGLALAWAAAHAIAHLLYETAPADLGHYLIGVSVLAVVAGLATWPPVRRALKTDPISALRNE